MLLHRHQLFSWLGAALLPLLLFGGLADTHGGPQGPVTTRTERTPEDDEEVLLIPQADGSIRRERILRVGGGNTSSDASVARGLRWLAAQQADDGRWSVRPGADDVAATAYALLPFLAVGETHQPSKPAAGHSLTVSRGLKFLVASQRRDGSFPGARGHALATLVLCEAFGLTADPALKGPAQKALDFLLQSQHKDGTWGAAPPHRTDAGEEFLPLRRAGRVFVDDSVRSNVPALLEIAWQVMAAKSGQMVGLKLPGDRFHALAARVGQFLDRVAVEGGSRYAPFPGAEPTPEMTATGLLCRLYLGDGPRHPAIGQGIPRLLHDTLPRACHDAEHLYLTAHVFYLSPGTEWEEWAPRMRKQLADRQARGAADRLPLRGSWPPAQADSRLVATALSLLCLEFNKRLPLYRR